MPGHNLSPVVKPSLLPGLDVVVDFVVEVDEHDEGNDPQDDQAAPVVVEGVVRVDPHLSRSQLSHKRLSLQGSVVDNSLGQLVVTNYCVAPVQVLTIIKLFFSELQFLI